MTSRARQKWDEEEDNSLIKRFQSGEFPSKIASDFGRTELAIRSRLTKHGLLPKITQEELDRFSSIRSEAEKQTVKKEKRKKKMAPADIQQAFHRFHCVYAIINPKSHVYIGYSHDVWHRVGKHNTDKGAKATRENGPWFPFSIICLAAMHDAKALEIETQKNFSEFKKRNKKSLQEVLAQIGVPFDYKKVVLLK